MMAGLGVPVSPEIYYYAFHDSVETRFVYKGFVWLNDKI